MKYLSINPHPPELDGLGQVPRTYGLHPGQIGNGPGNLQNPIISPG
jgi:hypothetical protein